MNEKASSSMASIALLYLLWKAVKHMFIFLWPFCLITVAAKVCGGTPEHWAQSTLNALMIISFCITIPIFFYRKGTKAN